MYHLYIYHCICSGQIYFILYSTLNHGWSFCSNFKVVFLYTSKTKPHLWSVPLFKINSWTVKKALRLSHRLQRKSIFLFQLPLKTDKYIGFLHFPFTRHKKYQRRSHPLLCCSTELSMNIRAYLVCPLQHFSLSNKWCGIWPMEIQRQQGDYSLLGTANKHGISAKVWFFRICSTIQLICHSLQLTKLRVFITSKTSGYLTWDSSDTMRHHSQRLYFKHLIKSFSPLWLQSLVANETGILSRKVPIYC